ncbi:TGS domain-containing protein [Dongshaea marina]|uniref:TGS domain-containing protein n=1 Tax=Dongshaea marina TaxID=2047966 RepID=UPI000D3E162A|nr:TGS domain-containing protein [Dongshaea marina]
MPIITLADGSEHNFTHPMTVIDIAEQLEPNLVETCLAGRVSETLLDINTHIDSDVELSLVTPLHPDGLSIIRHTTSHLLGHAAKQLWPQCKIADYQITASGFYYDIDLPQPMNQEMLQQLEQKMAQLVESDYPISTRQVSWRQAHDQFEGLEEPFKIAMLDESIPRSEHPTLYFHQNYVDMGWGPHAPSLKFCRHFKLLYSEQSHWRDDPQNHRLQRIHAAAWSNDNQLQDYLSQSSVAAELS